MFHIAIKAALLSTYKHRMGAVVVKNGRVLSIACNSIRHKKGRFDKKWINSLHAEQAALLQLTDAQTKRAILYIVRVKSSGAFGSSFPCPHCQSIIIQKGIKRVHYINGKGEEDIWQV